MLNSECVFCGHGNGADATFCNQCGGLLELKRCDECDAVNKLSAPSCAKCGAELVIERDLFESIAAHEPARLHYAVADRWSNMGRGSSIINALQRRIDAAGQESVTAPIELGNRVRPFRGSVTLLSSAAQRMAHVVPVRIHEERARISLVNRVGLPLLLVATVCLTVYWAYSLPAPTMQAGRTNPGTIRTTTTPASTAAASTAGTFAPDTATISVGARSPTVQGRIRTSELKRDENVSIDSSRAATASVPAAAEASRTASQQSDSKPIVAHAPKREPRDPVPHKEASRTTMNSSPDTYTLLMRASSGDGPRDKPSDGDRRRCTSEIAALGLCALREDVKP